MSKQNEYDVFISYNSKDRLYLKDFFLNLAKLDLNTFIDIWHLTVGKPWQEELESAILRSKTIAIFIGKNGIGKWQNEEMRLALDIAIKERKISIVFILLPNSSIEDIPSFFNKFIQIDFRKGFNNWEQYDLFIKKMGIKINVNNIFLENKKVMNTVFKLGDIDYLNYNFSFILSTWLMTFMQVYVLYFFLKENHSFIFLYMIGSSFPFLFKLFDNSNSIFLFSIIILGTPQYISIIIQTFNYYKDKNKLQIQLNKLDIVENNFNLHTVERIYCDNCKTVTPSVNKRNSIYFVILETLIKTFLLIPVILGYPLFFFYESVMNLITVPMVLLYLSLTVFIIKYLFSKKSYHCLICGTEKFTRSVKLNWYENFIKKYKQIIDFVKYGHIP